MSQDDISWKHRVERTIKSILETDRLILKALSNGGETGRRTGGFGFIIGQPKPKYKRMPLELKITSEQQIKVTVSPKTDTGKVSTLDGAPAWTVISGNSQVIVADDGLSAILVSSNDPGDTQILVKADANLGTAPEEYEEISDTIKLTVIGPNAKNLGLAAGTPEAKPDVIVPPPQP